MTGEREVTRMVRSLTFSTREIRDKGGLSFSESVPVEEFFEGGGSGAAWRAAFGEAALDGPCGLRLEFSVGGERILLEGTLAGSWRLSCGRCLAPHAAVFAAPLEETYPLAQQEIAVWEELRQALVLNLPFRSLCSPACRGLCPRCGANLNAGPCACS